VKLLRCRSERDAKSLAERLDRENEARREIERAVLDEAISEIEASEEHRNAPVLVLGRESWHPGVVGIVASRIVDRYGKPAILVGSEGKGSGRSGPAFALFDALSKVAGTLDGFGGHAHAAGVRVKDGGLDTFRDALCAHAEAVFPAESRGRVLLHDGPLALDAIDQPLIQDLARGAPFGSHNAEPVFRIDGVVPRSLRELSGGHAKCVVRERPRIEAVLFGRADRIAEIHGVVDLLATPDINEWRGTRTLQLRIRDLAPGGARP
jgi:single-stranded-DNA-specific exonuclease